MADKIYLPSLFCFRKDTMQNWQTANPILEDGEPSIVVDNTGKAIAVKVGNGVNHWNDLPLTEINGGGDVNSVNGQTGDVVLDAEDVGALPDDTPIPTKTSDLTNDSGFGTYSKPSGGIPKTDLDTNVKSSLEKADSALQEHQSLEGYATEDYVDDAVSTKYTKPDDGIPETDLASAVKAKINNSYVYDTKPYEVITIGDEDDGSLTLTEALTTRLVINKDINNVNFNFRKILVNITVPAEITEGTPNQFLVGTDNYSILGTPTIGKVAGYPMKFTALFELRNGRLFSDGAYVTGSPSNPQGEIIKSYNAFGRVFGSLTTVTIEGQLKNLPAGTNIKILAVKGE